MADHFVFDGSNLATEGRTEPSLTQLQDAVAAFLGEHPGAVATVVVDASFEHRIDPKERDAFARTGKLPQQLPKAPRGTLIANNAKLPLPLRRFRPAGDLVRLDREQVLKIQFPLDGSRIEATSSAAMSESGTALLPVPVKVAGGELPLTVLAARLAGGEVPEWSIGLDSKSSVRLHRTVGSNPTLSATHDPPETTDE